MNVVDFDEKYIVSASGDRTIKVLSLQYFSQHFSLNIFFSSQVWSTSSCEFVRTLNGHKRGIACLQYHDRSAKHAKCEQRSHLILSCTDSWSPAALTTPSGSGTSSAVPASGCSRSEMVFSFLFLSFSIDGFSMR